MCTWLKHQYETFVYYFNALNDFFDNDNVIHTNR